MPNGPLSAKPRIALIAGEASGDQLGAELILALQKLCPEATFFGVGGDKMRAAGFETWWDRRELSVMGLFEVLSHLPRLLKLRRQLRDRLIEAQPDVLIGIDAPDFNLGLEKQVRKAGIKTIHYVSPTVWAWREGRAKKIRKSADLILCLFPFEPPFYAEHGVTARYTGHPLADMVALENDVKEARSRLQLAPDGRMVALLPGSRGSEVSRLAVPMLEAARRLHSRFPGTRFVVPLPDETVQAMFTEALGAFPELECTLVTGNALDVMAAANVVVCASGTAALECMLVNRPMVVVYRFSATTYYVAKTLNLVKAEYVSLPNILANEGLVPELIQSEVTGERIAAEVESWFNDTERTRSVQQRFSELHHELRINAAESAAEAVLEALSINDPQ